MKDITIPILIAIAVTVGTVLHKNKTSRQEDEADKVKTVLMGIHKFILPGASLTYNYVDIDPDLVSAMHGWCRYQLAPAHIAFKNFRYDTVLTVCRRSKADSFLKAIAGKKVLWQNEDDQHYYFLTSSH